MWIYVVVAAVALMGVGLVLSQLFTLKDWLKNAPRPEPEQPEPDASTDESTDES
jgi:hypothetical protein